MIESIFGIKISSIVAGISGGIVSLIFEEKLSFVRAVLLIFAGGTSAGYFANYLEHTLSIATPAVGFYAFLVGLTSMRLIKVLFSFIEKIQKDPLVLIQFLPYNRISNGTYLPSNSPAASSGDNLPNSGNTTNTESEVPKID